MKLDAVATVQSQGAHPAPRRHGFRVPKPVGTRTKHRRVNPFKSQTRMLFLIICGPLAGVGMLVVIALGDNAQLNHTQYAPDGAMIQSRTDTPAERTHGYCNQLRWPAVDAELDATTAAAWERYGRTMCIAYPAPAGAVR